jgi:hypothetical protein
VFEPGVVVLSLLHQNVSWTFLAQTMTMMTTSDLMLNVYENPHFFKVVMPPISSLGGNDSVAW